MLVRVRRPKLSEPDLALRTVTLFVHGNSNTILNCALFAKNKLARWSDTYVLEYPGYVENDPPPTEAALRASALRRIEADTYAGRGEG